MDLESFVCIVGFFIEVYLIFRIEKQMWGTAYTPINILMLPSTAILIISLIAINLTPEYKFYYPSILIWSIGLLFFEIPSVIWARISRNTIKQLSYKPVHFRVGITYIGVNGILCALFIVHYYLLKLSGLQSGTDEFGKAFATYGFWGHLNLLLMAFTVANIILLRKGMKYKFLTCAYIAIGIWVCFLNQVKGWVLIPIIGGLVVRLLNRQTKLKPRLVLGIILIGGGLFFLSYYVALVLNNTEEDSSWFWQFFIEHFIFYLTSGFIGLSESLRIGANEVGNVVDTVVTCFYPFRLVVSVIFGDIPTPYNGGFIPTLFGESNVRTFFGEMYIRGGIVGGALFTMINSFLCYGLLWLSKAKKGLFLDAAYGFIGGVLFMGWFSAYTDLLTTYEFPILCILIFMIRKSYKDWMPLKKINPVSIKKFRLGYKTYRIKIKK